MEIVETAKKAGRKIEKALLPKNSGDMDILDTLKKEHREVDAMLKKLVASENAVERKALLKKIRLALVPHIHAEQKVVYDAIIANKDKQAKTDGEEGYLEHELAERTLQKLEKISNATSPEFNATAKVLKELVEHHVQEEEHNVWKDVKEHFDGDDRIEMNRRFEAAKKRLS